MRINPLARRLGALMTTAAMTGAALSGFGAGALAASPEAQQNVVFWQFSDRPLEIDAYNALIEKFEAANPGVTVQMEIVPWADQQQKLTTALASGGLPDVSMLGNNVVAQYQHIGALAPLDEYIAAESTARGEDITKDYWPGDGLYYNLDGQWWGAPVAEDTLVLFYRKSLLEAAGLEPPTTWDEFKAAAEKLTGDGVYGAGLLQSIDYVTLQAFMSVYLSYGARFLDEEGKCGFDTPEFREALDYYTSIFKEGWTSPDAATETFADMEAQWKAGQLAMAIDSAYLIADTIASAPEIAADMGIAQIPSGPKGQFAFLGGWPLVLWDTSQVKDAAARWIMFATNAENVVELDRAAGQLPGRASAASLEPWNAEPYTTVLGQLPNAYPYQYPDPEIPQMGGLEVAAVQTAVQAVALDQASLDDATTALCDTINEALAQ